jgi:hypothetical protein
MRKGFGPGASGVLPTRVNDSALCGHTSLWDWTMPEAVMSLRPRKARGRSTALPELGNCGPSHTARATLVVFDLKKRSD